MEIGKKKSVIIGILIGIVLLGLIGIFCHFFRQNTGNGEEVVTLITYGKHYAFICDTEDTGEMWESVYQGAKAYGEEHDICVEWFGSDLVEKYSKSELMNMAIAAKVDGIMIQGDDSSEMNKLVNQAEEAGIPVIAMWADCYGSYRTSFVGMSSYNLGQEYGNYIVKIRSESDESVLAVIRSSENDSSEKLIFAGLKETLYAVDGTDYQVETLIVDDAASYSMEESVRERLLSEEEMSDIVVCFDEQTTDIFSRLVVDYNQVGESEIIGFYSSNKSIQAIESGVMTATLSFDSEKLGESCVQALETYMETGYVSDYIPVEIETISSENVKEWADE
ncbi:MAG: sugar ABC transporter substrate-binding protein [Roseburia sp.]